MEMNGLHRDAVFQSLPRPTVVLDTDFVIRAVNKAYLTATAREAGELLNVPMFDAFPDNPEEPEADGVANLSRSLEQAARSRRSDNMLIQRYDLHDPTSGNWLLRHWSPLNTPVLDDTRVVALLHQVEDVTPLQEDLQRVMQRYRDIMLADRLSDAEARRLADAARAFARSTTDYLAMAAEIMHLRHALTSRATIEQAKGLIMAERRCTPEVAFDVLARISQGTNVKVVNVAAALVCEAHGPMTEGRTP